MKFSEQWLRSWINPPINTQELADQLSMSGLEVEAVDPVAAQFNGIVVGEVLSVEPHPNADRLRVCQVNVGESTPLGIVCGASNVRAGLKAPVAKLGAVLPQITIKPAKLRGVDSAGMLCSASELGLAETSQGLLELPTDAPVGTDIDEYLKLNDHIITINITPNRGDCLSILGVAREVSALNRLPLQNNFEKVPASINDTFKVTVTAPSACPHYVGRVIRGINPKAVTPIWMQEALRRSGLRSIHPVVDITNYVMLELGQPMHAFDLAKLNQEIIVKFAHSGEKLTLLDGQEITLSDPILTIADKNKPVALAGVMGGADSAVTAETTNIFLESAYFAALTVRQAVKAYNLTSDSSYRFERGVDPLLQTFAIEKATKLLLEIAGGQAGPVIDVCSREHMPKTILIKLRPERVTRILGVEISATEIEVILNALGMQITKQNNHWNVQVPSYRFDLSKEIDLIEETARIYGYQRIPTHLPSGVLAGKLTSEAEVSVGRMRSLLIDRGYREVITYSFVAPQLQQAFDPQIAPISLVNPISSDMSVMRTNMWPGLIKTIIDNQSRQNLRARIFETGLVFLPELGQAALRQVPRLAGAVIGEAFPMQWGEASRQVDFFDMKGDIEVLFRLTGNQGKFKFAPALHPALHPNKTAAIYLDQQLVGYLGAIHPELQRRFELKGNCYLFELDLALIQKGVVPQFSELSKFPAIRRDLALVIDQQISAKDLQEKIMSAANELLKNVQIFDIYQGKGIDLGKKSVALGLTFQHSSRTLIDDEVNESLQHIVAELSAAFGAKLRE